jgi:hypothetical protein
VLAVVFGRFDPHSWRSRPWYFWSGALLVLDIASKGVAGRGVAGRGVAGRGVAGRDVARQGAASPGSC